MNTQTPLPLENARQHINVHSVFPTIQGEGPFAGRPAIFVRLFGCNLQCPGCDTDYTSKRMPYTTDQLLDVCDSHRTAPNPLIVLTGGEPFRQDIRELVLMLLRNGYAVQVESNGTVDMDLSSIFEWTLKMDVPEDHFQLVISPKTAKVAESSKRFASAWKYILQAGEVDLDGLPKRSLEMKQRPARPPGAFSNSRVYVQPMDEKDRDKNQANTAAAVASCMKFGFRMSLQTHKILGLE